MTDEKRIEEIRARHAAYLGGDRHAYSRADVYAPDDVGELLSALDAERARAERAEAERDAVADFLIEEDGERLDAGDSLLDGVRKVVLGLRAERDAALAEVDRVTSIANINATNVDASQAECASLRVRMEKAEADRALGAKVRAAFASCDEPYERAELVEMAILDALREEGGR